MLHKDNLTSVVDTWYNLSLRCVPQTPHSPTSASIRSAKGHAHSCRHTAAGAKLHLPLRLGSATQLCAATRPTLQAMSGLHPSTARHLLQPRLRAVLHAACSMYTAAQWGVPDMDITSAQPRPFPWCSLCP